MQMTASTCRRAVTTTVPMVSSSLYMGMPATTKDGGTGSCSDMVFTNLSGDIDLFSRILLALGWFVRLVGKGWAHQMAEAKWGRLLLRAGGHQR